MYYFIIDMERRLFIRHSIIIVVNIYITQTEILIEVN